MPKSKSNKENAIFKFDRHAKNIHKQILNFYKNEEFFDTILVAGQDCLKFQAHSIVLSAASKYFYDKFLESHSESESNEVELKEIDSSTFKLIIDFMYSGSIELSLETIGSILRTAVFLNIKALIKGCCNYIKTNLNSTNNSHCLNWLRLAKEFQLNELKKASLHYIFTNFKELSKEKSLLNFTETELIDLLFKENPYDDFQDDIFLCLIAWIEYDKENRKHLQTALFSKVCHQFLTPKFIVQNLPSETEEDLKLIYEWLEWHRSPDSRSIKQLNSVPKRRKLENKLTLIIRNNVNELEILSITDENSWSIQQRKPLSKNKFHFSMILHEEKLILVGGIIDNRPTNSIECLDLRTLQWTDLPPMQLLRAYGQLEILNGNLFVFGGYDVYNEFVHSIEMYNLITCKWQYVQPLFQPSKYSKMVAHNGILYIVDFYYGHLQSYDCLSKEWIAKFQPIYELTNFGFAACDRYLYLIGGYKNEDIKTVKRYDPSNDAWCEVAPLPKARSHFICTTVNTEIIIYNGNTHTNSVQKYNPDEDKWTTFSTIFQHNELLICSLPNDFWI